MKDLIKIQVESHSGYKANEYPVSFYWENIRFEIQEIVDRWYEKGVNSDFPAANYFKVKTGDEKIYLLKHEVKKDQWFLWIRGEAINL